MATPAAVLRVNNIPVVVLNNETKPWEVKVGFGPDGEPRLHDLTPAQAAFREELMWQGKW